MSARIPTISLILIALAALLSFSMQRTEHNQRQQAMQAWAASHARWSNRASSELPPNPYWRWRAPVRGDRLSEFSRTSAFEFLQMGAGQEVWVVNEAAQVEHPSIAAKNIPLISVSTASFLGVQIPDDPRVFETLSEQVVAGLEPWRQRLEDRCGSCAPTAGSFPAPSIHRVAGSEGIEARGAIGISIGVEQHRRTALPIPIEPSPMVTMVKRIREGGEPTAHEWASTGLAGMAALEMSVQRNPAHAALFLQLARQGPSRTDQIAGLWAAKQVGATDPTLSKIASNM
jgi:hypothetical protein